VKEFPESIQIHMDAIIKELTEMQIAESKASQIPKEDVCSNDSDTDALTRSVCLKILRDVGVYDAHGCPLCLS